MKLLSRAFFFVFFLFCLVSCEGCGNSSSKKTVIPDSLKIIVGSVHNTAATSMYVQAVPITINGQLTFDDTNQLKGEATESSASGRYSLAINADEAAPFVIFASSLIPDDNENTKDLLAEMQCQLVNGCQLFDKQYKFGEYFSFPDLDDSTNNNYQTWKAAVETTSEGQFIAITPFTEMASAFGFTSYIADGSGSVATTGTVALPGYYSKYGIAKSNTQMADLIGLSDITSVEPANLFKINTINASNSQALQESIRYGALNAAIQELEFAYNNAKTKTVLNDEVNGEDDFWRVLVKQYLENKGQLYQKNGPSGAIMTMEQLYTAAINNLKALMTYASQNNISLPNEVTAVIAGFESQKATLQAGQLTTSKPSISAELVKDYANGIDYTKALVGHLLDLRNRVATPEFRQSITDYQSFIKTEGKRLTPAFDMIMKRMEQLGHYYAYCLELTADVSKGDHCAGTAGLTDNYWSTTTDKRLAYDASEKTLTIFDGQNAVSGETAEMTVTHRIVDTDVEDDDNNPTESTEIDMLMKGVFSEGELALNLTDFKEDEDKEDSKVLESSVRFTYEEAQNRIRKTEDLEPLSYEMVFPNFSLFDKSKLGTADEVELTGSFSLVLTQVTDSTEANDEIRYNLNAISTLLTTSRQKIGEYEENGATLDYRDVVTLTLQGNTAGTSAFYPDTKFPVEENFFIPRSGLAAGESIKDIVRVSKGIETLAAIKKTTDGAEKDTSKKVTVEYLDYDYVEAGIARFRVYPLSELDSSTGKRKFVGSLCLADEEYESNIYAASPQRKADTGEVYVVIDNPNAGEDGQDPTIDREVFFCSSYIEFETDFSTVSTVDGFSVNADGDRLIDEYIRQLWKQAAPIMIYSNIASEGTYSLIEIPKGSKGYGTPFSTGIGSLLQDDPAYADDPKYVKDPSRNKPQVITKFPDVNKDNEVTYQGIMFRPNILGINNIRMTLINPRFVTKDSNGNPNGFQPKTAFDINLSYPSRDIIDVAVFFAFDTDHIVNTEQGLPFLAAGDNVESYYLSYKTDETGREIGSSVINWGGVKLVNGELQNDSSGSDESEGFLFNISSEVSYANPDELPSGSTTEGFVGPAFIPEPAYANRCGLTLMGDDIAEETFCSSLAYLTFKGLVVGVVREERDDVFVIRYIDGSWQIIQ